MNLDISIFRAINSLAGQSVFADSFWVFTTDYLPYVLVGMVFITLLIWRKPLITKVKVAGVFVMTAGLSYILVLEGINKLLPRLRPFDALSDVNQLVPETGFSFPSKHALLTFLLASYVYAFNKRLGIWLYVFATLIAISRVIVGVHYPSDIVSGAVIGVLVGIVGVFVFRKINKI